MSQWSLEQLLASLQSDVERRLEIARRSFGHPGTKGDVSEAVWLELLGMYLPKRYQVASAHVVDSKGAFSHQLDVVVFDRQYTPFIFSFGGKTIIPAESVYAVFEAKQSLNADQVSYASEKIRSVRALHRTSLPVPYVDGVYKPKTPHRILGGILTFESDWSPALGDPLQVALGKATGDGQLDLGCVAAAGMFSINDDGSYALAPSSRAATAFLFDLIARLQASATVPMIDIRAYAQWLAA